MSHIIEIQSTKLSLNEIEEKLIFSVKNSKSLSEAGICQVDADMKAS